MPALMQQRSNSSQDRPIIVPVLPIRGQIDPALDRIVSDLARRHDGPPASVRNALYIAYAPRLRRILTRLWYRNLSEFGCELDDLEQELFLIFDTLLERWSGAGSLSAYLHGAVPWRLYDAARRLAPRDRTLGDRPVAAQDVESGQSEAEMILLLDALADQLSPFDRALLLEHICDEKPLSQFAAERGMSQRTVRRAWLRLQQHLRRELDR